MSCNAGMAPLHSTLAIMTAIMPPKEDIPRVWRVTDMVRVENPGAGRQDDFLERAGWQEAGRYPLPADASFRRYVRLVSAQGNAMLVDAPKPHESLDAYLRINRHLAGLGLRVPRIMAADEEAGLALIEDFGESTFTRLLQSGVDEPCLYAQAANVLRVLHRQAAATDINRPRYDMDLLMGEAALFIDWFVPAARGHGVAADERQAYLSAWRDVLAPLARKYETFVLRDYHVDNLMIVDGAEPTGPLDTRICGLLDFQDGVIGQRAYDLVSLVEDARRDVGPDVRAAVLDVYCTGLREDEKQSLFRDMRLLGAQRHAKVLGIFVRLWRRDGKPGYLRHLPRVQRLLCTALEDTCLRPVANCLKRLLPDLAEVRITAGDDPTDDTGAREQGQTPPSTASNSLS